MKYKRSNTIIIFPHQGLGDLLICNGIFREFAKKKIKVFVMVKKSSALQAGVMLQDISNIRLLIFVDQLELMIVHLINFLALLNFEVIRLGSYGSNFIPIGTRVDQSFYDQAGLSLDLRWDNFIFARDRDKEQLLYSLLVKSQPYIFLHEDQKRDMVINRNLIDTQSPVVEPLPEGEGFTIFDYLKIIENASEIHVIESSFAHLIESVGIRGSKFAHRYARPLVMSDFRQTPTYRLDWHIIT
jgi:hypothetical protein